MNVKPMPKANIAVSLDTPLFPVRPSTSTSSLMWKSLLGLAASDVFRVAAIAFCLALALSVVARSTPEKSGMLWKSVKARVKNLVSSGPEEQEGVPMAFNSTDTEGWGVCTLRSKRRFGKSSFVQYDFDLPRSDNVLHLELGQQLSLCCLDNSNSVAKGDFYLYHGESTKLGTFSILAPNRTPEDNTFEVGKDAANFVRVLKEDLKVGDEVALKPGKHNLEYRGQFLPVTDMVYIASGVGIVPILDQIKAILPSGSSSVRSVSVIWVNEEADDFDITADELEKEYFKYSTKLAVSCIVDNVRKNKLEGSSEVEAAVPEFQPGVMAVLSGPRQVMVGANEYLRKRGYPADCICVL